MAGSFFAAFFNAYLNRCTRWTESLLHMRKRGFFWDDFTLSSKLFLRSWSVVVICKVFSREDNARGW